MKTLILTAFFIVLCVPFVADAAFDDVSDEWAIFAHEGFNKETPLYEGQRFSGVDVAKQIKLAQVFFYFREDWRQTRDIKNHPGFYEMNPVLGRYPSDTKIDLYFAGYYMAQQFLATWLPEPYASSLIDTVAFSEHLMVEQNTEHIAGRTNPKTLAFGFVFTSRF